MRRPSWKNPLLLLVVLFSFSCARLPEWKRDSSMLAVQMLEDEQSVWAEWGQPAAVSDFASGRITRVWYQGEDGTIRLVRLNNARGRLELALWVIQRK